MTTADSPARALPRTSENLLLHETGEGTTVQLAGIVKEFGATRVLHGVAEHVEQRRADGLRRGTHPKVARRLEIAAREPASDDAHGVVRSG